MQFYQSGVCVASGVVYCRFPCDASWSLVFGIDLGFFSRSAAAEYAADERGGEISLCASRPLRRSEAGRKNRLAPFEMTGVGVVARRTARLRRRALQNQAHSQEWLCHDTGVPGILTE